MVWNIASFRWQNWIWRNVKTIIFYKTFIQKKAYKKKNIKNWKSREKNACQFKSSKFKVQIKINCSGFLALFNFNHRQAFGLHLFDLLLIIHYIKFAISKYRRKDIEFIKSSELTKCFLLMTIINITQKQMTTNKNAHTFPDRKPIQWWFFNSC